MNPKTTDSRRALPLLPGLLAAFAAAGPASAHDCWIRPDRFRVTPGQPIAVRVLVGHGRDVVEMPRREARTVRLEVHDRGPGGCGEEGGPRPLPGRDGRSPAGYLRAEAAGLHVLVYESRPTASELDGARFTAYLREEGLDDVLAAREEAGESAAIGREGYARCAKALVRSGDGPATDRAVGLPYEAVVETELARWRPGDPLALRFEWGGRPIAGRLVTLGRLDADGAGEEAPALEARTDGDGRVTFGPLGPGAWMASSVHMRRALPRAARAARSRGASSGDDDAPWEWESFWASTAFELEGE